jgi:hypothetical protein
MGARLSIGFAQTPIESGAARLLAELPVAEGAARAAPARLRKAPAYSIVAISSPTG